MILSENTKLPTNNGQKVKNDISGARGYETIQMKIMVNNKLPSIVMIAQCCCTISLYAKLQQGLLTRYKLKISMRNM
jgi:hypothetical protein